MSLLPKHIDPNKYIYSTILCINTLNVPINKA